jgi:hypothetical protein
MPAKYLRDLEIRGPGQWAGKEVLDWLHPCHGPLPDKVGIIEFESYEYCVALWCATGSIVTMTELVDYSNVRDSWQELAKKKGWIVNSLRWSCDLFGFSCTSSAAEVLVKPLENDANENEWMDSYFRRIMMMSVEITASMPLGCPVLRASDLIKRRPDGQTDVPR